MNNRINSYIKNSLAYTGFCILDAQIAFELRPGHWPTITGCSCEFNDIDSLVHQYAKHAKFTLVAEINGRSVVVVAMSHSRLMNRIKEITGMEVKNIQPYQSANEEIRAVSTQEKMRLDQEIAEQARLANIQRKAAMEKEYQQRRF